MTESQRLDAVADAIRTTSRGVGDRPIRPDSRLVEDLGLDSLDIVSAVMSLEDRVGQEIDPDLVPTFRRVSDILGYLAGDRAASAA